MQESSSCLQEHRGRNLKARSTHTLAVLLAQLIRFLRAVRPLQAGSKLGVTLDGLSPGGATQASAPGKQSGDAPSGSLHANGSQDAAVADAACARDVAARAGLLCLPGSAGDASWAAQHAKVSYRDWVRNRG